MNTTYDFTTNYSAADAIPAERVAFIRRTYLHVAAALAVFGLMELYLVTSGAGAAIAQTMLSGRWSWLIVLGLFMGI